MFGILLSFGSGLFTCLQAAYSKKALISQKFHDWTIMLVRFLYVLPLFIVIWLLEGVPHTIQNVPIFILIIVTLVTLEVVSQWTFHQSIKLAPLSEVMPFQTLTPIFIIPINFVLTHQGLSARGMIGVGINTLGLFFLYRVSKKKEVGTGLKMNGGREIGGIGLMIVTAILWSVTTTLQKIGAQYAGVALFGIFYIGGVTLIMLIYHLVKRVSLRAIWKKEVQKSFLPIGIFAGLATWAQYVALTLINPAYVSAIKRSANISTFWLDRNFFKEKIRPAIIFWNLVTIVGIIFIVTA